MGEGRPQNEGTVRAWSDSVSAEVGLLKDRAYGELKELIMSEALPSRFFLSERQLAVRLGMSKTPVRSALERLQSEGFVDISPRQGVVVRELSVQQIVDLFDIRTALETFVVRRLAGRLTAEQRKELRENFKVQGVCVERRDLTGYARLDAEFHQLLCRFLGNQEICRTMWNLRDRLHRMFLSQLQRHPHRLQASYKEHAAIADALIEGNGELSASHVEKHLDAGKRFMFSL